MTLGQELNSSSSPEAAQTHQSQHKQQPSDAPLPDSGLPDSGLPAQLGQQIRDSQHSRGHAGLSVGSSTLANKYTGELCLT